MNSNKVLLKTYTNHPAGYGIMPNWDDYISSSDKPNGSNSPLKESNIWEQIQKMIPKNGKYIKHFVESDWIENKNYPINDHTNRDAFGGKPFAVGIPKGDLNYWLTVYWEEN